MLRKLQEIFETLLLAICGKLQGEAGHHGAAMVRTSDHRRPETRLSKMAKDPETGSPRLKTWKITPLPFAPLLISPHN
jgi:hypothetical protein